MEDEPDRRTQTFMSALYMVASRVRHTLHVFEHDVQRWRVCLDETNALLSAIFEVGATGLAGFHPLTTLAGRTARS
jgi:hypothetical protein